MSETFEAGEIRREEAGERQPVVSVLVEGATVANIDHPKTNQDAFFRADNGSFGVFDGMGGRAGGEIAARIAREIIGKVAQRISPDTPAQNTARLLRRAFQEANEAILQRANKEPGLKEMGTTASVAVLVDDGEKVVFAHVGDSRIYLGRGRRLYQMTKDDSVLRQLVREGGISEEKAKEIQAEIDKAVSLEDLSKLGETYFKKRNQISARLGKQEVRPQVVQVTVQEGDWLLAFSDGIHENLTAAEINEIFKDSKTPKELAQNLRNAAYQRSKGGHFRSNPDDITVIAGRITAEKPIGREKKRPSLGPIQEVESFQALFKTLDEIGGIQGSERFYSPSYLKQMIGRVRSGKVSLEYITRTRGLRGKVRELLEKERGGRF